MTAESGCLEEGVQTPFGEGRAAARGDGELLDRDLEDAPAEEIEMVIGRCRPVTSVRSDEALMVLVQRNDQRAFEALYDRHRTSVYWLAMRILDDRDLAADATQEAFVRLWRNRDSYQPGRGQLKWWLMRIVRNGAIDLLRHEHDLLPLTEEVFDLLIAPDSIEDEVLAVDAHRELSLLLRRLPTKQREVIELAYFDDLTQAEITGRLGIPLGTIKGRTRLALEKLREALPGDAMAWRDPALPSMP